MDYRVFISYTTKNQWVIPRLEELILKVRPGTEMFCSATGSILPGDNYKNSIFENLSQADVFIAIVSNEYWESKYCIVELGAAYQRYWHDPDKRIDIQPLILPPLEKNFALANTPLTEIQVTDLTDTDELSAFLRRLAGPENEKKVDELKIEIAEYVAFLKKTILTTASMTDGADVNAYYDEPPANPIPKDAIVQAWRMERDDFMFKFNLSKLNYTPSFASMALEYHDEVNLQEYLKIDREASLCFRVKNNIGDVPEPEDIGILESITVELKSGPVHEVFRRIPLKLEPGENQLSIPLSDMNSKALSAINQICFVIYPKDMKKPDGIIKIDQIHVAFEGKNILTE